MARRMAFAIFRWFFGRRPVSLECFIRPVSLMYSDMIVKFCACQLSNWVPAWQCTHLVLIDGVDAQHVKGIARGLLAAVLPLLLLGAAQVVWRVDVTGLPFAIDLALELAPPLRLDHLARLGGAVEAGLAREAGREGGVAQWLLAGGGVGCAAEDVEEDLICWASVRGSEVPRRTWGAHPASATPTRSIAGCLGWPLPAPGVQIVRGTCWRALSCCCRAGASRKCDMHTGLAAALVIPKVYVRMDVSGQASPSHISPPLLQRAFV